MKVKEIVKGGYYLYKSYDKGYSVIGINRIVNEFNVKFTIYNMAGKKIKETGWNLKNLAGRLEKRVQPKHDPLPTDPEVEEKPQEEATQNQCAAAHELV